MQYDNVFWNQSDLLKAAPGSRPGPKQGVASGVAQGGIGDLQDGTFFRRIRPFAEGTAYDVVEYRLILALENNQFSSGGLDEFWVGLKDVPIIGTIRVGHIKNQFGIEADTTASSRTMTFMERSASSDAIYQNQNYVTGVLFTNNYLDQRVTWEAEVFRADLGANSGVFFGDGQYGAQARLTGLPIYEDSGRDLLHLGLSGGWRDGTNNLTKGNGAAASESAHIFQTRARPELRDDTPAAAGGGPGALGGAQTVPDANSNRLIDTGVIAARDLYLAGTELLWIRGPLSIQAEYGWQFVNNAVGFAPSGTKLSPQLTSPQNYIFSGGYVQVAYTLTGENRAYDKRLGTLAREYFGKTGPYENLFQGRDPDGDVIWGTGAWEIAGRYTYVNLNDGVGLSRVQGGVLNGYTLALNWYLNSNLKIMFDCVYDRRSDLPTGANPGSTKGFGIEVQYEF
jgi:phosphate-selective porin OprO/OprP